MLFYQKTNQIAKLRVSTHLNSKKKLTVSINNRQKYIVGNRFAKKDTKRKRCRNASGGKISKQLKKYWNQLSLQKTSL